MVLFATMFIISTLKPSRPMQLVHREFDEFIHKLFFRFGLIVHKSELLRIIKYPGQTKVKKFRLEFLVASLVCTTFCAYGLVWIEEQSTKDPQFVFSPRNALWRYEKAVISEHWPLDEQRFWPGKSYDLSGYLDIIGKK
ncbi:hypothetical protein NECAME_01996 [Necator americanus]|uniref:Uncharacterized protein n=1 Tax=Necator americanus TaxID=51031 RepID=W2TKX3_NECAM|nr:hypothetical protein NECAME_01996 [Necator americanus]ETN82259.1 hypothetical protein NECAME_01996 [Necator americanus]